MKLYPNMQGALTQRRTEAAKSTTRGLPQPDPRNSLQGARRPTGNGWRRAWSPLHQGLSRNQDPPTTTRTTTRELIPHQKAWNARAFPDGMVSPHSWRRKRGKTKAAHLRFRRAAGPNPTGHRRDRTRSRAGRAGGQAGPARTKTRFPAGNRATCPTRHRAGEGFGASFTGSAAKSREDPTDHRTIGGARLSYATLTRPAWTASSRQ